MALGGEVLDGGAVVTRSETVKAVTKPAERRGRVLAMSGLPERLDPCTTPAHFVKPAVLP